MNVVCPHPCHHLGSLLPGGWAGVDRGVVAVADLLHHRLEPQSLVEDDEHTLEDILASPGVLHLFVNVAKPDEHISLGNSP